MFFLRKMCSMKASLPLIFKAVRIHLLFVFYYIMAKDLLLSENAHTGASLSLSKEIQRYNGGRLISARLPVILQGTQKNNESLKKIQVKITAADTSKSRQMTPSTQGSLQPSFLFTSYPSTEDSLIHLSQL